MGTRATAIERRLPLPGDEIVRFPCWQATRAVTIDRAPSDVWPWLVQMGYPRYRAGWYTPYWLDRVVWRIRERSAERIVDALQSLSVGDRIEDSPDGTAYFTVARIEAPRVVVLLSTTHPLALYRDARFSWSFVLVDAGDRTRLIMRARVSYTPVWHPALVRLFFATVMSAGDAIEAGGMLRGIRRRVEAAGPQRQAA